MNKFSLELENQLNNALCDSLAEIVKSKLGGYNSPLDKILNEVVESRKQYLFDLFNESFSVVLNNQGFKEELIKAFNHKLSRVLLSKFEGEVEKRANEIRSTPESRARITLAIESAIKGL